MKSSSSSWEPIAVMRAVFKHGDAVGAADGAEPVGDHEDGASLHEVGQRGLHQRLALGIECRGGLVENENGRVLEDGAGDGHALAFAAGETKAFLADDRVVALRHAQDEVMRQRVVRGLLDQIELHIRLAVGDVVAHRVVEEDGLLRDLGNLAAQRGQCKSRMSWPSMRMRPEVTSKKRGMRLTSVDLPAPLGPTSASTSPARTSQIDIVQDLMFALFRRVREAHILELNELLKPLKRDRVRPLLHVVLGVEEGEDRRRCAHGLLEAVVEVSELAHRIVELEEHNDECAEDAHGHVAAA